MTVDIGWVVAAFLAGVIIGVAVMIRQVNRDM